MNQLKIKASTISQIILTILIPFIIRCSDGKKTFIGKHTIGLPLYTIKYDTSISFREFGNTVHPEINYYDFYSSTIDLYESDDKKTTGQFKYVYPDRGKLYSFKPTVKEQTFVLNNFHTVNDTLKFLMEVNPTQGVVFEGCMFLGNKLMVGLPKKLFTWIEKTHCTEGSFKENSEYMFFEADQLIDRKELYKCQADSLKNYIISNPKYIDRYKPTIDYLTNLSSN